jgi:hypothetical protein
MLATILVGIDWKVAIFGLPVFALAILAAMTALGHKSGEWGQQMKISGATLLANLLSSLMFIPAAVQW